MLRHVSVLKIVLFWLFFVTRILRNIWEHFLQNTLGRLNVTWHVDQRKLSNVSIWGGWIIGKMKIPALKKDRLPKNCGWICQKAVPKNFGKFIEKYLCRSLFLLYWFICMSLVPCYFINSIWLNCKKALMLVFSYQEQSLRCDL